MPKLTSVNHRLSFSIMIPKINFDFSNKNKIKKLSLLISEPFSTEKYFSRSVILLCDHGSDGSFGFVLNNYTDIDIDKMIPPLAGLKVKISVGGPLDNDNLFYIHNFGEKLNGAIPLGKGMYLGGNFKELITYLKGHPSEINNIRFFLGYSGWSEGQLDSETTEKAWVAINKYPKTLIFNTEKIDLWQESMKELGGKFNVMSNFPINPSDN